MIISSPEFSNSSFIPSKFTCEGRDINPTLEVSDIPQDAKSLVLIVDDPDAPMGTWVHWVVFNVPVLSKIKENSVPGTQGINDFGKLNYGGPCPPSGVHRYFFKIYALDSKVSLKEGSNKESLKGMMEGHVIAKAELVGLYKRGK